MRNFNQKPRTKGQKKAYKLERKQRQNARGKQWQAIPASA